MKLLQRVANCVLTVNEQVLLLQKPSHHWWVAPGGKMESGETVREAVEREFREETGLMLEKPLLRAVQTIVIMEQEQPIREWMMFTFQAYGYKGTMVSQSPEGDLAWKQRNEISRLPMAEGDSYLFQHVLNGKGIMFGTFYYTPEFKLLSHRLQVDDT